MQPTRTISIAEADAALERLDALARLMDSSFVLPGTGVRFGLDTVIGLFPVIGDLISQVISSYIIWEARRLGVSRWIVARMIGNSLIDTVVGMVPVAGDAFDVLFRANIKNVALLRRHLARQGAGSKVIEGEAVRIG
ncbi:MAG: DUF4112 domain-containing protein [Hyphomicrobiaceae bacterium]